MTAAKPTADWNESVFQALKAADVRQVPYVPDAGHSHLIRRAHAEPTMKAYPLTTEEEGVAAVCGAWLGGERAVLLMQSSGVGNCINMLSLVENGRFPFVTLVTMRGEWAEFNPWQVPMGRATETVLGALGVDCRRVTDPARAGEEVAAALDDAFLAERSVAVLFSQSLLGRKTWVK
jgi:sulfopyruvate decarboxylase alpha subunit